MVVQFFNQKVPSYTYHQAALNPLNPDHRADPLERGLIQRFQENPQLTMLDGFRTVAGVPIYYVARPVRTEAPCLRCHGDPDTAPVAITDRYGRASGFHWPVGKTVSVTVISVPTEELAVVRRARSKTLIVAFALLLVGLLFFNFLSFQLLVNRRLKRVVRMMERVKADPHADDRLFDANPDELGFMARAFNEMADSLKLFHRQLEEKVRLRTEALTREIQIRKKTEMRLRHLSQQNEMILNAAGDGIYGIDLNGNTTFINPAACQMTGWKKEALIGRFQHDILHHTKPDGSPYPSSECFIYHTLRSGKVNHVEGELFWRRDGGSFPVEYTSTPLREGGRIQGAVVVFRDVTERLHTETELLAAKERAEQYLAIAGTMIVALDRTGAITLINDRGCALLGYERQELLGKNWIERIIPPANRESMRHIWKSVLSGDLERVGHVANEVLTKSGEQRLIAWHNTVIRAPDGTIHGTLSSGEDITESQQLEQALLTAREQADSANHAKSAFLSTMSHEIRTPMNAIIGMAELLGETGLNNKQKKLLRVLEKNGEVLLHLIDDILDLSRVESGRLVLERIPFDLKELVTDIIDTFRHEVHDKPLRIAEIIDVNVNHKRLGDPNRLRQLLMNLVGNAVKFTEEGVITVHIKNGHDHPNELRFFVADTGIGIPMEKRAAIFDVFTQVDDSTTRKYGGSGLGLTICKRLVTLMGGTIQVNSREGKGSLFQFTAHLPLATARDEPPLAVTDKKSKKGVKSKPAPDQTIPPATPMRILLAEDSEDNILLFQMFLKKTPHEITVAVNGEEAVEHYRKNRFDLVFMDMQMPVLDGYRATELIRRWERENQRPPAPILALTAYVLEDEKKKALKAGCDRHLKKPIKKQRLLEVISEFESTGQ